MAAAALADVPGPGRGRIRRNQFRIHSRKDRRALVIRTDPNARKRF